MFGSFGFGKDITEAREKLEAHRPLLSDAYQREAKMIGDEQRAYQSAVIAELRQINEKLSRIALRLADASTGGPAEP
jgi:hypothetical protein